MTQITSIKLGLIAICFASVALSLAQTPRTGASRSSQIGAPIGATAGHTGILGNSTSAAQPNFRTGTNATANPNVGAHIGINAGAQIGISNPTGGISGSPAAGLNGFSGHSINAAHLGTNFPSSAIIAPNTNVGGHLGINTEAQTGISNSNGGITGGAAGGLGSSSGNSTETTQIGTNARAGTNSTANTNAGTHTAAAAAAPAGVTTILSPPIRVLSPSPNNSPIGSNFSTAGESPPPLPSASVSPTPTPTPAQLL